MNAQHILQVHEYAAICWKPHWLNWSYEFVHYSILEKQVDGSIPLYRFFNTQTGSHFYTAAEAEKDSIIENLPTFNFEGTAYWVDPVMGWVILIWLGRFTMPKFSSP